MELEGYGEPEEVDIRDIYEILPKDDGIEEHHRKIAELVIGCLNAQEPLSKTLLGMWLNHIVDCPDGPIRPFCFMAEDGTLNTAVAVLPDQDQVFVIENISETALDSAGIPEYAVQALLSYCCGHRLQIQDHSS